MDAVELVRGQRVAVELRNLVIGVGWESPQFDLDAAAFPLAVDGQIPEEGFFVFYNNLKSPDGAIRLSGDSRIGRASTEAELINVDLERLDTRIQQILFTVTIYKAELKQQNFGQVKTAFIRISDTISGRDICRYDLQEDFSTEIGIEFGRLYRDGQTWRFEAIGNGTAGGLTMLIKKYARQFAP
jgi:tellurium resistance protein TerD